MKRRINVEELLEENQVKIYRSLFQIEKYPAINRMKLNEITARRLFLFEQEDNVGTGDDKYSCLILPFLLSFAKQSWNKKDYTITQNIYKNKINLKCTIIIGR